MIASLAHRGPARRRGFTLIELMITITIIALMAGALLFALFSASETAKAQKTKALIAKLDAIIKAKYEAYKTRRVPIQVPPAPPPSDVANYPIYVRTVAQMRLDALHDLMRMEMPDRWSDVSDQPTPFSYGSFGTQQLTRPAVSQGYLRRYTAGSPTNQWQSAECLYLIIMQAQNEEADDRSVIKPEFIADTDQDGFPEIVDAWGTPISFLRWAPGFISELQVALTGQGASTSGGGPWTVTATSSKWPSTAGSFVGGTIVKQDPLNPSRYDAANAATITGYSYTPGSPGTATLTCTKQSGSFSLVATDTFYILNADPFDPRHVYPNSTRPESTWATYPLIYSYGPNRYAGVVSDDINGPAIQYSTYRDSPFLIPPTSGVLIGSVFDDTMDPRYVPSGWLDNIHNHMITAR